MIWRSLKFRLLVIAIASIVGALFLYWTVLNQIFGRHVLDRLHTEMQGHLNQLITRLEVSNEGVIEVPSPPENPRFSRPFGGLYWQVETKNQEVFGSRSLWDQTIDIAKTESPRGAIIRHQDIVSNSGRLIAVERTVLMKVGEADQPIRLLIAMDQKDLDEAMNAFDADTLGMIAVLALFLFAAASVQIFIGLRPLNTLRDRLHDVTAKKADRMEGQFPSEDHPLVDELNGLLSDRGEMVERARASASDLAHGLKTPLAILSAEARTLTKSGRVESADEIFRQVKVMNNQTDRQLARARVRGRGRTMDAGTELRPAFEKLTKAFAQLPKGADIEWKIDVPDGMVVSIDQMDFEEIAGNILDNARKWTSDKVTICALRKEDCVEVIIEDNGPGVADSDLKQIVERGERVDESAPGTGLGLSIVDDVLEIYGGRMRLESAAPSGLRVVLTLVTQAN